MSNEMLKAFDVLDVNTKRNQISNELLVIFELIKQYENNKGIIPISSVKNYDPIKDEILDESEMLTFFYEDIFNIQQELITLLSAVNKL